MPRSISTRLIFVVSVVLAVQLAACGGDDKRTKKAAKWLKSYSQTNPPNGDWIATSIKADGGDQVVMDVLVPYKEHVDQIKSRTKIEQAYVVRLACPPTNAEIWTILDQEQILWINLTARTKSGLIETLAGASCKR